MKTYIPIFLLLIVTVNIKILKSQEKTIIKPTVNLNDGYIECSDFPGISKDGRYIINEHRDHYCGYINDSIAYYLNTSVHKVWKARILDIIFISFGIIHQADGCDIGPNYKILGIKSE